MKGGIEEGGDAYAGGPEDVMYGVSDGADGGGVDGGGVAAMADAFAERGEGGGAEGGGGTNAGGASSYAPGYIDE